MIALSGTRNCLQVQISGYSCGCCHIDGLELWDSIKGNELKICVAPGGGIVRDFSVLPAGDW